MRCAIVASGTTNARAISAVVSPPTARSVSATWEEGVIAGWQQRKSRVSVSSLSRAPAVPASASQASAPASTAGGVARWTASSALAPGRLAAQDVGQPPGGDREQPGTRVVRHPGGGPLGRRGEQCLLHRVLAAVKPRVAAHEHAEDLRREFAQQVLGDCVAGHLASRRRSDDADVHARLAGRLVQDRPDLDRAVLRGRHVGGDRERALLVFHVEQAPAGQVLLGLQVGAVGDGGLAVGAA